MKERHATRQHDEWAIVHLLRRTKWHIQEGWEDLDRRHRGRWIRIVVAGFVVLLALTAGLVIAGRTLDQRGYLAWEDPFMRALDDRDPIPFAWAIWLESPGNGIVLWPLVIGAAGIAAWRRRPLVAVTILLGFIALDAAVLLGWNLWKRPRPTMIAGGAASPSSSFSAYPSGHVSQTLVAYGLLVRLWIEQTRHRGERLLAWSLLALLVFMVAVARLRLGAHWPTDIVAGAIVGLFWLVVLSIACMRGETDRRISR